MATIVATTTWNSIDHAEIFLAHYRKLGAGRVLVMDYDSTDGTAEMVGSCEWQDFVTSVPFPGLAGLDSSNEMLGIAAATGSDDWCLFCDPDELLVTPSMRIDELAAAGEAAGTDWFSIPRFNVTAPRSHAKTAPERLTALDGLDLRIDRRVTRAGAAEIPKMELVPPWIYTAVLGKVFVRVGATYAIGEGDHSAKGKRNGGAEAPAGAYLLHYPFRRYETFAEKIARARLGFEKNPHLSEGHGWQLRRWIRMAQEGTLRAEYDAQFVDDEEVARRLADGTLCRDSNIRRFHGTAQ